MSSPFSYTFNMECKQKYVIFLRTMSISNISRSPPRSYWLISILIPCTRNTQSKHKSAVELLVSHSFHTFLMRNITEDLHVALGICPY